MAILSSPARCPELIRSGSNLLFGFAGRLFDPDTGKVRKAWVFVMVLGYSRHMYAQLVWNQKASTWVRLHVKAFKWFEGVPRTIVPDNLKAAVVRGAFGAADRDRLALNRTYRELARHYGFKVDPTPAYQPRKRGKVEAAVKYVKANWMAAGDFGSLQEANEDLADWLLGTAGVRIHGATGRRPLEAFAEEALMPLPATAYEWVIWKEATVHRDSDIAFDGRLYSVPWLHICRKVWVSATRNTVRVYADDARVATHARRGRGRRSAMEEHLPRHRRDLAHRSADYWIKRADRLGREPGAYVREILASDEALSKLRDVQAIVTYLEQFPLHRARAACRRARFFGNHSYQGLKRILVGGLDFQPLPQDRPRHGHLSQPRFARSVVELLAPTPGEMS